jgi:AcrR family transcriptional regulator
VASTETRQPLGLRERKKRRTRLAILDSGIRLFFDRGYEATTIIQIADAADVAPSTVFKYFPTKVAIVFSLLDAIIESATIRISNRPAGEPAADALIAWLSEDLPRVEAPYTEAMRLLPTLIDGNEELQADQRLRIARLEDLLAAAFADDLDEPAEGIGPRVLATIAMRGMTEIWLDWHSQHSADDRLDTWQLCGLKAEYLRRALPAGMVAIQSLPRTRD